MIICEHCHKKEATVVWTEYESREKHLCIKCYSKLSKLNIKDEFLDELYGLPIT